MRKKLVQSRIALLLAVALILSGVPQQQIFASVKRTGKGASSQNQLGSVSDGILGNLGDGGIYKLTWTRDDSGNTQKNGPKPQIIVNGTLVTDQSNNLTTNGLTPAAEWNRPYTSFTNTPMTTASDNKKYWKENYPDSTVRATYGYGSNYERFYYKNGGWSVFYNTDPLKDVFVRYSKCVAKISSNGQETGDYYDLVVYPFYGSGPAMMINNKPYVEMRVNYSTYEDWGIDYCYASFVHNRKWSYNARVHTKKNLVPGNTIESFDLNKRSSTAIDTATGYAGYKLKVVDHGVTNEQIIAEDPAAAGVPISLMMGFADLDNHEMWVTPNSSFTEKRSGKLMKNNAEFMAKKGLSSNDFVFNPDSETDITGAGYTKWVGSTDNQAGDSSFLVRGNAQACDYNCTVGTINVGSSGEILYYGCDGSNLNYWTGWVFDVILDYFSMPTKLEVDPAGGTWGEPYSVSASNGSGSMEYYGYDEKSYFEGVDGDTLEIEDPERRPSLSSYYDFVSWNFTGGGKFEKKTNSVNHVYTFQKGEIVYEISENETLDPGIGAGEEGGQDVSGNDTDGETISQSDIPKGGNGKLEALWSEDPIRARVRVIDKITNESGQILPQENGNLTIKDHYRVGAIARGNDWNASVANPTAFDAIHPGYHLIGDTSVTIKSATVAPYDAPATWRAPSNYGTESNTFGPVGQRKAPGYEKGTTSVEWEDPLYYDFTVYRFFTKNIYNVWCYDYSTTGRLIGMTPVDEGSASGITNPKEDIPAGSEIDAAEEWGTDVPNLDAYKGYAYDHADKIKVSSNLVSSDGKIIIKRYFRPGTYTIIFNGNGHESGGPLQPQTYVYTQGVELKGNGVKINANGSTTPIPGDVPFVKNGYQLAYWCEDSRGESYGKTWMPGQKYGVNEYGDKILYAVWKQSYMVYYNSNYPNGITNEIPIGDNYTANSPYTIAACPTAWQSKMASSHYYFKGWNTKEDGTGIAVVPGESKTFTGNNIYLYAQWSTEFATLTVRHYKEQDGGKFELADTEEKTYSTSGFVTPETKTYSGYRSPNPVKVYIEVKTGGNEILVNYSYYKNTSPDPDPHEGNLIVRHYKQVPDTIYYTLADTDDLNYDAGTEVTPPVKEYEGYTSPNPIKVKIGNVKTYVDYYYDCDNEEDRLTVPYTINHFKQRSDGSYPSVPDDVVNNRGTVGVRFTFPVKSYPGYTSPTPVTMTFVRGIVYTVNYRYKPGPPDEYRDYTVEHYKQKTNGSYNNEPDEVDRGMEEVGTEWTAPVKDYTGYKKPALKTIVIDSDPAKNLVKYYYELDNGSGGGDDDFNGPYSLNGMFAKVKPNGSAEWDSNSHSVKVKSPLAGAKFCLKKLYQEDGTNAESNARYFTTDSRGTIDFNNLSAGTYSLKETSAPSGYRKSEEVIYLHIVPNFYPDGSLKDYIIYRGSKAEDARDLKNVGIVLKSDGDNILSASPQVIVNEKSGTLHVYAVDTNGDDTSHGLSGAVFEITDEDNKKVDSIESDDSGYAKLKDLKIGKYKMKETTAPRGYKKMTTVYPFEITEDKTEVTIYVRHSKDNTYPDPNSGQLSLKTKASWGEVRNGKVTVNDVVTCQGFGTSATTLDYQMVGYIVDKSTGQPLQNSDGSVVYSTMNFRSNGNGSITMQFMIDVSILKADQEIVVYENACMPSGAVILAHADLTDKDQTLNTKDLTDLFGDNAGANSKKKIQKPFYTVATVNGQKYITLSDTTSGNVVITDTIRLTNIGEQGAQYKMLGYLVDKATGKPIEKEPGSKKYISSQKEFVNDGSSIVMEFTVPTSLLKEGMNIVVFENILTPKNEAVEKHLDLDDSDQTIAVKGYKKIQTGVYPKESFWRRICESFR